MRDAGSLKHLGFSGTPVGKVVPGYIAKVVDDEGGEVPRGTVGKLAVIGPTACKYLGDSRQTSYVKNGWNYPGDAFVQDDEGYFYFQSRADDMIISAGYNISGIEVEDCLLKHSAVSECAVIGQPDAERGMLVKAYCVLHDGYAQDVNMLQALQEYVKTQFGPRYKAFYVLREIGIQVSKHVQSLQDHVKPQSAPFKYPRVIEFMESYPARNGQTV